MRALAHHLRGLKSYQIRSVCGTDYRFNTIMGIITNPIVSENLVINNSKNPNR